jgi:hypothetical protein
LVGAGHGSAVYEDSETGHLFSDIAAKKYGDEKIQRVDNNNTHMIKR